MASFKAAFDFEGHTYEVITCEYKLSQDVDASGKPTSNVKSGCIELLLNGSDDETLANWAVDPQKTAEGTLTFYQIDSEAKFKELKFEGAYCVGYFEQMGEAGQPVAYALRIRISAAKLTIGGVTHDNHWP